jgi:hypothetical protein
MLAFFAFNQKKQEREGLETFYVFTDTSVFADVSQQARLFVSDMQSVFFVVKIKCLRLFVCGDLSANI